MFIAAALFWLVLFAKTNFIYYLERNVGKLCEFTAWVAWRGKKAKWQTFSFNGNGRMDFDVIFCGFFGLRFEKFFNNIFYCMPYGQNRKRDVLMHVTLTII